MHYKSKKQKSNKHQTYTKMKNNIENRANSTIATSESDCLREKVFKIIVTRCGKDTL